TAHGRRSMPRRSPPRCGRRCRVRRLSSTTVVRLGVSRLSAPARFRHYRRFAMKLPRRRFLQLACGAAALPAFSGIANAQSFPVRPITIVVPFAAGGPIDTLARIMAEGMHGPLGQPVVVENVTGAAGNIGVGRVARAPADGYTLVAGFWGTHVVNGAVYDLPYDVLND